ncbi:MAG: sigma-70 family RNA polymerase sigma factor [Actinomycetota bacterium]
MSAHEAIDVALTRLAREDGPRVLSVLASRFGDLDLADDAVQDALVDATRTWPRDGMPGNPGGWLMTAARNRATDRLRRQASTSRRLASSQAELVERRIPSDAGGLAMIDNVDNADDRDDPSELGDERLRLMLLCCHPALGGDAQVALILRLVAGLTTEEIAAAFLVPPSTMAQRIVRAKRKIRTAAIPMSMPDGLDDRLGILLDTLYLVFNEGYLAHGDEQKPIRLELMSEALRLTRLLIELSDRHPEVLGLLAMELFARSRTGARTGAENELILLEDQDRTTWDLADIHEANAALAEAMARMQPGPRQVQALIGSHHANARTAEETDWPAIVGLYAQLDAMVDSPVIALNHAVAVAMADGPLHGLRLVEGLEGLDDYHLYWSAVAELNVRAGRSDEAIPAFERSLALTTNEAERRHLTKRLAELG